MMRYVARFSECLIHFALLNSLGEPRILLALFVVWGSVSMAHASFFSWNALNGQFNDSANWTFTPILSDSDGVPDANDVVTFRRGSIVTYTVTFPGTGLGNGSPVNYVTDQLRVGNNNVSFVDGNSTVRPFPSVPSTYTVDNLTTGIIVGETASDTAATLTTRLATLSATAATVGDAAGSNGTLNVSAGALNVNDLTIGYSGTGTITANGGDVSVSGTTLVGLNAGSNGTVNVSNANSTWTTGGLYFGSVGDGTLNVTGGGTLNTGDAVVQGGATVATVMGATSTWTYSGGFTVEANATLNISDGGQVAGTAPVYVGNNASDTGSGGGSVNVASGGHLSTHASYPQVSAVDHGGAVTVTGAGSIWDNDGELDVERGGIISVSAGGSFGGQPGIEIISASGHVSVQGAGSTWLSAGTTVENGGTLTVSDGGTIGSNLLVHAGGTLEGNGNTTDITSGGIVAPGNSLGALHSSGRYTQGSTGSLQIELGGTMPDSEYDQLLVSGSIALDGTLNVTLVDGFTPQSGATFNILDFANLTGTFSTVNLPPLTGVLVWKTSQLYVDGTLSVGYVPGDYNHNGVVDAADYTVWRDTLGQTGISLAADGNNNGMIDSGDYDVWNTNFGRTAGSGAGGAAGVPEPATLWLLLAGVLMWCCCRRVAVP